jgi:hypothetical protein
MFRAFVAWRAVEAEVHWMRVWVRQRRRSLVGVLAVLGVVAAPLVLGVVEAAPAGAAPNGFMLIVNTLQNTVNCQLAQVDLGTGVVTPIGSGGPTPARCANDLAETSDGRVFGIVQEAGPTVHLLQYDTTSGDVSSDHQVGTFNASIGTPFITGGLTFDKNGNLFVQMGRAPSGGDTNCPGTANTCLYRVDPANPANATFVGPAPVDVTFQFLTAACDGRAMDLANPGFGVAGGSSNPLGPRPGQSQAQGPIQPQEVTPNSVLGSVNLTNGAVSPVGSGVGATNELAGIAFDTGGTLWGVGEVANSPPPGVASFNVFTIDTTTGVATKGTTLTGLGGNNPLTLALPLNCATPTPPPAAAPVVITPRFTG